MTRKLELSLAACLSLALSCGPAVPDRVEDPAHGGARIAGDAPPPDGPSRYEAPPHRFNPRPHLPRARFLAKPPPDLSALPPLRTDFRQCFGVSDKKDQQIASGPSRPAKKPGPARHSQSSGKKKKEKKRPSSRSRKAGGASFSDDALSGVGGGYGGGAAAPAEASEVAAPSAPPPPAAQPAPAATPAAPAGGEYWRDELGAYRQPEAEPAADRSSAAEEEALPDSEAREQAKIAGADEDADQIAVDGEPPEDRYSEYEDWGSAIYLSNDDTMSLSSAQRVIYAIDNFLPLPLEHIRPHELLNYFSFETAEVAPRSDFSVLADVASHPDEEDIYTLALAVRGRQLDRSTRRNTALTLVIDRSGSMRDEGRMDYLKRGLRRMVGQLKDGDIINIVVFDHNVCVPMQNFVVGRDDRAELERAIGHLRPRGSTDLHRGLTRGYELADAAYQAEYTNRVLMVTDALTNTGVTDERMISMVSKYYDKRRIRLSGVGVGRDFNDSLLDRLTERGKGAYVFLGSEAEVDAVFGPRFISLVETTALDVHFQLHLPPSLRMNVFYGEESSTVKEDVQAIHYFANTSQLFLSDLMARGGALRPEDDVMLTVEYEDPESGDELFEEYAFNLGEAHNEQALNVRKGRLIMAWADLLALMASRPAPYHYGRGVGSWDDADGWRACDDGRYKLEQLARGIESDGEVVRVLDLWERFCSRYERPRNPVRRVPAGTDGSWPGAQPPPPR